MMTVGSLFAGIGGFDLALERSGFRASWQVEINPHAQSVLRHHWPTVDLHADVSECGKGNLDPVYLICGGFPCQDLSVAGKRAGLAGQRSGLFYQMTRIVDELRPAWVILENVPGLISSNNGRDMAAVLDTLEEIKYIVDVDILDAQFFGLAQRRRRVFFVCQSLEDFQRKRTLSSSLTMAQCLAEMLHLILEGHQSRLASEHENLELPERVVDGLKRRMRLFDLPGANGLYTRWLQAWGEECLKSAAGPSTSACEQTADDGDTTSEHVIATDTSSAILSEMLKESTDWLHSIRLSWNSIWGDVCSAANACITSTGTRTITESTICTFSQTVLHIVRLILLSKDSCPSYWNAESSVLTVLREYISYARQASESLFGDMEWVCPWRDFLRQATSLEKLARDIGARRCAEILALATRCEGNPPKGSEAAERVAACLRSRSHKPGVSEPGRGGEDDENLILAFGLSNGGEGNRGLAQQAHDVSQALDQHGGDPVRNQGGMLVVSDKGSSTWTEGRPTLSASDDNGTNHLVFVHPRQLRNSQSSNQVGIKDDGLSDSLTSEGPGAVAFNWQSGGDVRLGCSETHVPALHQGQVPAVDGHLISHALRAEGHDASEDGTGRGVPLVAGFKRGQGATARSDGWREEQAPTLTSTDSGTQQAPGVQVGMMVRRLTPVECSRLQGFPDDWLDIDPPLADSAKYRLLGNAVAIPVVEWIGRRIMEAIS